MSNSDGVRKEVEEGGPFVRERILNEDGEILEERTRVNRPMILSRDSPLIQRMKDAAPEHSEVRE